MSNRIKLGIGSIRFPQISNGIIDLSAVCKIIQEAQQQGVNFIDTSYAYLGGQCEVAIGLAIENKREQWEISTRFNPVGKKRGDLHKYLHEQLKRLRTDYIDYYGFHGIDRSTYDNIIIQYDFLEELIQVKNKGLVKNIGFSFHDIPENMIYIIDAADVFDYVICQYNFVKSENKDALDYAKKCGLKTVIMGPFCGGKVKVESDILNLCKCNSAVEMALRYVLSNTNVDIILSGVRNIKELIENISVIKEYKHIDTFFIDKLVQEDRINQKYYCTGCGYCMPCTNKINIPEVFNVVNGFHGNLNIMQVKKCSGCGECEQKCPQKLEIRNIIYDLIKNISSGG